MVPALVALIGAASASQFGLLDGRLAEIFPQDAAKRIALGRCETESGAFDRFSAGARDACYRRTNGWPFSEPPHATTTPNQLDLRTAAARGTAAFETR